MRVLTDPLQSAIISRLSIEDADVTPVSPQQLIRDRSSWEGRIDLFAIDVLSDVLLPGSEARVALEGQAIGKVGVLKLRFEADLKVTCQRCLETMTLTVEREHTIQPLTTPESEPVGGAEAWYEAEHDLSVENLLGELILVALPMSPRHHSGKCEEEFQRTASLDTMNPFAVLLQK